MSATGRGEGAPAGPGLAPTPGGMIPTADPVGPRSEPTPVPERESLEDLAAHIVELAGPPVDVWAIAALLESIGIRDRDAVDRYGRGDVFSLAQAVEIRLPEAMPVAVAGPPEVARRARMLRFARHYGRGTFFFLPLGLQLIALLTVGISQFAALSFTLREASVLAAAAALSFLVTAAFTQALGYLAPMYSETGKHMLAETVSWNVMGLGAVTVLAVGAVTWAIVAATGSYPADDMRIAAAYYALLSAQGLTSAMLYMLRRFMSMIVATIVALVVAGLLYKRTDMAVEQIHWISLAVGVAIELVVASVVLSRRARDTHGDLRLARLPRVRILARRVRPFALYGLLYFGFLTVDRGVAWSAGDNPLPFWFHPSYELGLDWALAAVVFSLAFLEVTVESFSDVLVPTAERFKVDAIREHNASITRFWARQLAFVGVLAAAGTLLAIGIAMGLDALDWLGPAQEVYDDPITRYVFGFGVLGYALLALAIANSVFVMSLNRPWRALASIGPGVLVSLVVGLVATAHFSYWTAVFGMVAGAAVFAALSGWQAWRTLHRADYFNYAAW